MFFMFFAFASVTTVIAVFENIVAFAIDLTGCSRAKSCLINFLVVLPLSVPTALGFSLLAGFQPLGEGTVVLDGLDFIVSKLLLPIGALIYLLFCVTKKGWGWDNFLTEVNSGNGINFPKAFKAFYLWFVPIVVVLILVLGLIDVFK
jgi:NSS family neurotransmitter:Na+ symporter